MTDLTLFCNPRVHFIYISKHNPQLSIIDIGIHILISKVIHLFAIEEKIKEWIKFLRQF